MKEIKHGKPFGIHARGWLCALALGGFSLTAHAGYAQLQAPPGWSQGAGGQFMYRAAANEQWLQSTVRTNASLQVAGRTVTVPASMRLASNAPRFAARFLFTNPAIAIGTVALTLWLNNEKLYWDEQQQKWVKEIPGQDTEVNQLQWTTSGYYADSHYKPTKEEACTHGAVLRYGAGHYGVVTGSQMTFCYMYYPNGSYRNGVGLESRQKLVTIPGDPIRTPVGDIEFEDKMAPTTLPEVAPSVIPIPWPVELPKLNPVPMPSGNPQPIRIPTGDPYQVPNTDPAQYRRPAVDIVPSPTPSSPWRVDVQPKDIPVPDLVPRPLPPPTPLPTPLPPPDPNAPPVPEVDPNAPPQAGENKEQDLCEKNPDILACQKLDLDTPQQEIPRRSFAVTFAAETLFGNGSCPANKTMNLRGQQITVWDFQKTCNLVETYLKPLLITLALFSAFMILSPGKDA